MNSSIASGGDYRARTYLRRAGSAIARELTEQAV
jgi:hypothetical protein